MLTRTSHFSATAFFFRLRMWKAVRRDKSRLARAEQTARSSTCSANKLRHVNICMHCSSQISPLDSITCGSRCVPVNRAFRDFSKQLFTEIKSLRRGKWRVDRNATLAGTLDVCKCAARSLISTQSQIAIHCSRVCAVSLRPSKTYLLCQNSSRQTNNYATKHEWVCMLLNGTILLYLKQCLWYPPWLRSARQMSTRWLPAWSLNIWIAEDRFWQILGINSLLQETKTRDWGNRKDMQMHKYKLSLRTKYLRHGKFDSTLSSVKLVLVNWEQFVRDSIWRLFRSGSVHEKGSTWWLTLAKQRLVRRLDLLHFIKTAPSKLKHLLNENTLASKWWHHLERVFRPWKCSENSHRESNVRPAPPSCADVTFAALHSFHLSPRMPRLKYYKG